jgi:hypothetical protein
LFLTYLDISPNKKSDSIIDSDRSSNCSNIEDEEISKEVPTIVKDLSTIKNIEENILLPAKKYNNDLNYINSKQNLKDESNIK